MREESSPESLLAEEVTNNVGSVSDADVEAWYDANKARVGGRTLDQVKESIRGYLMAQRTNEVRQAFFDGLKKKTPVRIALAPPRVDVVIAANDPIEGPKGAPVTIVEFSDFQCPYCSRVGPTIDKIRETYPDKVRVVYRDFPLPMHADAPLAAEAAQCANAQGKFWPYHDKLFANQRALKSDQLKGYAADLQLDTEKFNTCLDNHTFQADVDKDRADGAQAGVTGTPAFFVNGRFVNGAQPFEAFKQLIDEELALSGS